MKLFIGICVSSTNLETVMISSEDNEIILQGKFANDITGASEIKDQILKLAQTARLLFNTIKSDICFITLTPLNLRLSLYKLSISRLYFNLKIYA